MAAPDVEGSAPAPASPWLSADAWAQQVAGEAKEAKPAASVVPAAPATAPAPTASGAKPPSAKPPSAKPPSAKPPSAKPPSAKPPGTVPKRPATPAAPEAAPAMAAPLPAPSTPPPVPPERLPGAAPLQNPTPSPLEQRAEDEAAAMLLPFDPRDLLGRRGAEQEWAQRTKQIVETARALTPDRVEYIHRRTGEIAKEETEKAAQRVEKATAPQPIQRGRPLAVQPPPDVVEATREAPADRAVEEASQDLGVSQDTLRAAARAADVPLTRVLEGAAKGQPFAEVAKEAREAGVPVSGVGKPTPAQAKEEVRKAAVEAAPAAVPSTSPTPPPHLDPEDLDAEDLVRAWAHARDVTMRQGTQAAYSRMAGKEPPAAPKPSTYPEVLEEHARKKGLTVDAYKAELRRVGLDPDRMLKAVAAGDDPDDVLGDPDKGGLRGYRAIPRGTLSGFMGTDIADVPEVAREGEPGYARAQGILREIMAFEPPERLFHLEELYLADPEGNAKYLRSIADDYEARMPPDPEHPERRRTEAMRRARAFVAAQRTVGDLQGPFYAHIEDPLLDKTLGSALQPAVEIIGLDNEGRIVTRTESRLLYVFNMADVAQSAFTGAVFGPSGLSAPDEPGTMTTAYPETLGDIQLWKPLTEGAIDGIATRDALILPALKRAQEVLAEGTTKGEEGAPLRSWASILQAVGIGTGGLAATMVFPDLFMGAGGAVKIIHGAARAVKMSTDARAAGRLLVAVADARHAAATEFALAKVAREEGKVAEADAAYLRAMEHLERGQKAEADLRHPESGLSEAAHALDRADAEIAGQIAEEHPDIKDPQLGASLRAGPGKEAQPFNLHPAKQREVLAVELEGPASDTAIQHEVGKAYDTAGQLNWLLKLRKLLGDNPEAAVAVFRTEVSKETREAARVATSLDEATVKGIVDGAPLPPDAPPNAVVLDRVLRGAEDLARKGATPEEIKAWVQSAVEERKNLPNLAEEADDAEDVAAFKKGQRHAFIKNVVLPLAGAVIRSPSVRKVDRAIDAVAIHNETRAAGAVLTWKGLDVRWGTGVKPRAVARGGGRVTRYAAGGEGGAGAAGAPAAASRVSAAATRYAPRPDPYPALSEHVARELERRLGEVGTPRASIPAPAGLDVLHHVLIGARAQGMMDVTLESLEAQLKATGKVELPRKLRKNNAALKGTVPRIVGGLIGKSSWTADELSTLQRAIDAERSLRQQAPLQPAIRASQEAVEESTPSAWLQNWVEGPGWKGIAKAALATLLGANADRALLQLPPVIREATKRAQRVIHQGYTDVLRLMDETRDPAELDRVLRFLAGEETAFRDGAVAPSGGYDMVGAVRDRLRTWFESLDEKDQRLLLDNLLPIAEQRKIDVRPTTGTARAMQLLLHGKTQPKLLQRLPELFSYRLTRGEKLVGADARLGRALLDFMGVVPGAPPADSLTAIRQLIDNVEHIYGQTEAGRLAAAIAGHGQMERAIVNWVNDGIAVSETDMRLFKSWAGGEWVDAKNLDRVKRVASRYGLNPKWVEEAGLLPDTPVYVPAAVRNRMFSALTGVEESQRPDELIDKLLHADSWVQRQVGVLLRLNKNRMILGNVLLRQRYFWTNTADHLDQMTLVAGFRPAMASTVRLAGQNTLVLPFLARGVWALERAGRVIIAPLVEAVAKGARLSPEMARRIGGALRSEKTLEYWRRGLQNAGDSVSRFLSRAKYRVEVNKILEAAPGSVVLGGKVYTYSDLRLLCIETGVFGTFPSTEVESAISRVIKDELGRLERIRGPGETRAKKVLALFRDVAIESTRLPREIATSWGERERVGAFATLLELGLDAHDAGRIVTRGLFDYPGSVAPIERNLLTMIFLPFWAYQKNANRLIMDAVFSPRVAYRMGVLRRAREYGPMSVGAMMYDFMVEPYGVDIDYLPPEARDTYWRIREEVEKHYGGYAKVPPAVRRAVAALLAGQSSYKEQGRFYTLDQELRDAVETTQLLTAKGRVNEPDPSARRTWMRSNSGIPITLPMLEAVQQWYTQADEAGYYPTLEVALPESTIQSAMRHTTAVLAAASMLVEGLAGAFGWFDEPVGPLGEVPPTRPVATTDLEWWAPLVGDNGIIDPESTQVFGEAFKTLTGSSRPSAKVHPAIANALADDTGATFGLAPLTVALTSFGALTPAGDMRHRPEIADPALAGQMPPVRREGITLPPGAMSAIGVNSPVMELSRHLYEVEELPLEQRAGAWGELLRWSRVVTGFNVVEIDARRAAQAEERRQPMETTESLRVP